MIDAEPGVACERVSEMAPEGIDSLARMQSAERISPSLLNEATIGVTRLGREQRVVEPALRLVDVEVGRHDVVNTGEDDRRAAIQGFASRSNQRS